MPEPKISGLFSFILLVAVSAISELVSARSPLTLTSMLSLLATRLMESRTDLVLGWSYCHLPIVTGAIRVCMCFCLWVLCGSVGAMVVGLWVAIYSRTTNYLSLACIVYVCHWLRMNEISPDLRNRKES